MCPVSKRSTQLQRNVTELEGVSDGSGHAHETALKAAPGDAGGQGTGSWCGGLPHVCSQQGRG